MGTPVKIRHTLWQARRIARHWEIRLSHGLDKLRVDSARQAYLSGRAPQAHYVGAVRRYWERWER